MDTEKKSVSIYEDILEFPHPTSRNHPRMPLADRAAQFMPFKSLTGYEAAVEETARLTDAKPILSEEEIRKLNTRLQLLYEHLADKSCVSVTYFEKDPLKEGGAVRTLSGTVTRIDSPEGSMVLSLPDTEEAFGGPDRQKEASYRPSAPASRPSVTIHFEDILSISGEFWPED